MPTSPVHVTDLPSTALAVVRRLVSRPDLSAAVRDGCGRAFAYARGLGLRPGRNVAVYWDGEIHVEAGVELAADFTEANGIVRSATPTGLVASVTHLGPYQQLGEAHAAVRAWCSANSLSLAGPNWEVYGHWLEGWNADPSQIRTDVCYLVSPAGIPT